MGDNNGSPKKGKRILSVSLAAASLLAGASPALGSVASVPSNFVQASVQQDAKSLPDLLVLKSANQTQMTFQHESHSSHASHSSHHSHHSHVSGY